MHEISCLLDVRQTLAEGPLWDDRTGRLLWCDIAGQAIHSYDWESGERQSWQFPDAVGSFGLCDNGCFVVARRKCVVLFDPVSGEETLVAEIETDNSRTRNNDGKVGPDGAFYLGTMDDVTPRQPIAALYRVTADGSVSKITDSLTVSNGLAWSPDGRRLYHAETRPGFIDVWDFDPLSGAASNRRRLIDLNETIGLPDGATIDAEGNYWSAGVSAGVVNCISPEGRIIETVEMPVRTPTMPCFCGPDLDTLVVTSLQRKNEPELMARYPMSGSLFAFKPGVRGLPPYRFRTE
ncbi:SMP-30/gluconolactonase/LRE family protein [Stappia sp. F7233]|uniref:SMP-30/gluconolactonase/LRE family protein n=1 Tax=Stappia albiluteola TaxID=2758565 RepID=A0A839AA36_9HYPH|nr:SMP-30/gluconolactonase/LRE family protein [Stappia albiluteola]MBA5776046.1 SMP-30/gluconolactonase/LRE family protein [Stappia albiluteola]